MIVVAGATGFVGGHLASLLVRKHLPFRVIARSPSRAAGLPKEAEVVQGDITVPGTLADAVRPGDFVIHLVGIIEEKAGATFAKVHVDGTANLVQEAVRAGAAHIFYQSALGADRNSWSGYLKTKAEAEDIVRKSGLPHTIFRPSLIIGPWDGFTRKMVEMLKLSPVLPIPGEGKAKFQPVFIKDWLRCIEQVIGRPEAFVGTYDIGGPEHLTYRQIVEMLSAALGYQRPSFSVPLGLMKLGAAVLGKVLPSPPVTIDQLRLLEQDNIADLNAVEAHFGFTPLRYADALKEFIAPA